MKLTEAIEAVRQACEEMDARYGGPLFDEWAVVLLGPSKGNVLCYSGPRRDGFQKDFARDLAALNADLSNHPAHEPGDFEFARHSAGTRFDAFLVLGKDLYLFCNNTTRSAAILTQDPRWVGAQTVFVQLSEQFRSDPLAP